MICPYKHPAEITCAFCAPATEPLVDFSDYIEQLDIAGRSLENARIVASEPPTIWEVVRYAEQNKVSQPEAYERMMCGAPRPAPLQPGVMIDDEPEPARPVLAMVARWLGAMAAVATGAIIMYAEGQRQPQPGVGFAIGLALIVGAVFIVAREPVE